MPCALQNFSTRCGGTFFSHRQVWLHLKQNPEYHGQAVFVLPSDPVKVAAGNGRVTVQLATGKRLVTKESNLRDKPPEVKTSEKNDLQRKKRPKSEKKTSSNHRWDQKTPEKKNTNQRLPIQLGAGKFQPLFYVVHRLTKSHAGQYLTVVCRLTLRIAAKFWLPKKRAFFWRLFDDFLWDMNTKIVVI